MNVQEFSSAGELREAAAALIAADMKTAVVARGAFLLALSGGSTPKPVYERLSQPPYGHTLPWKETQVYFGDERMVPADNPESNFKMACDALLDHIDIPPWNVHRVAGEMQPRIAAEWYDRDLRQLAGAEAELPRFDLILLGLGPDGHTASLFPGTEVLDNTADLAAAVHLPADSQGMEHAQDRVTLTFPVINAARRIVFLVSGSDKAEAIARVEAGDQSAPAARVRPTDGTLQWMILKP